MGTHILWQWLFGWAISFHLEKSFGITKDNWSQVKARLEDDSRLLYPINNMCVLGYHTLGSRIFHRQRHAPSPTTAEHVAQPTAVLRLSCPGPRCSVAAAAHADYCLFWHFFWKELFRKVRYTGSSTYSFLNLELSTLCLFFSPWIMSVP